VSTLKSKRRPGASKPRRQKPSNPIALLALRVEMDDEFEEIALPGGVLLKKRPAEHIATRSSERLTDEDHEQIRLPTLLAERLVERLAGGHRKAFLADWAVERMSDDEREGLRRQQESEFERAYLARRAQGIVLDDREKVRLREAVRSYYDDDLSAAGWRLFMDGVHREWHPMAPPLRRELLEVPSVRWLLFGGDDGLHREDASPYQHARMLLTDAILFLGAKHRSLHVGARPASAEVALPVAKLAANVVAMFYPTLRAKMREPARIEHIRAAIASTATSAKRKSWKVIAATWDGIEARPRNPERWRVDYAEYTRDAPNRT